MLSRLATSPERNGLPDGNVSLATAAYGLALLLMLVAMTMNLGLFGSVLGGYFVGDALFLSRAPRPPSGHGPMNVDACCA